MAPKTPQLSPAINAGSQKHMVVVLSHYIWDGFLHTNSSDIHSPLLFLNLILFMIVNVIISFSWEPFFLCYLWILKYKITCPVNSPFERQGHMEYESTGSQVGRAEIPCWPCASYLSFSHLENRENNNIQIWLLWKLNKLNKYTKSPQKSTSHTASTKHKQAIRVKNGKALPIIPNVYTPIHSYLFYS